MLPTSWQHSFFSTDRNQQIKKKDLKKLNILTGIQQFFNFINMLEVMKVHLPNAKMEGTYFNQPWLVITVVIYPSENEGTNSHFM